MLVQYDEPRRTTNGGLHLPDAHLDYEWRATVVATGPGLPHPITGEIIPVCVRTGERVLITPGARSGEKLFDYGERMLMVREADVIAVIEDERVPESRL